MLTDKPCILIADDEPNICRVAKLMISSNEFDVLTAENGIDAFEKTVKFQPSLVFSDILMPKCDGFELCHKIKSTEVTKHIPFVFLTGVDEKKFKSRLAEVKADDYLMKPFSSHDMTSMISKCIKKPFIETAMPQFNSITHPFTFGHSLIDEQLGDKLPAQSFILLSGPVGSEKSTITEHFILEGILNEQHCLLISFESIRQWFSTPLTHPQQNYLKDFEASRWTSIDAQPWRNIDYIFDTLSTECAKQPYDRIIIDSFSHGFPFWSTLDILQFVDLCRSLPNCDKQCMLWTMNRHPQHHDLEYHLQHVMDIGITIAQSNGSWFPKLTYSKWPHLGMFES